MDFTELHFHLLPSLDDGPSSLEESLALAAVAAREGTRTIVATPHVNSVYGFAVSSLPDRVREVQDRLDEVRIPVRVVTGGELAHDMVGRLGQPELETIAHGPRGCRWVLLEAPLAGLDASFTEAADELRVRGFSALIAHPERSLATSGADGWPVIEHELRAGSAMQVNAWSLAGEYGAGVRALGRRVLAAAPRAVVASDAHGPHRPPSLLRAVEVLREAGAGDVEQLLRSGPRRLLSRGLARRIPAP